MQSVVIQGKAEYVVTQLVGKFPDFNVYICQSKEGIEYLLKIAREQSVNGLLDREAFILAALAEEMSERDEVFKRETGSEHGHGYRRCIPSLVETFVAKTQSNRRVNVLSIYGADSMRDLVPLLQYRTREKVCIDPKTSAWIMGRLLKILTLTQPFGVTLGALDGENIVINSSKHHVTLFDWTRATLTPGALSTKTAKAEIAAAACEVILALGGNLEEKRLPESPQLADTRYADMLFSFASGGSSNPFTAGAQFYELLDQLWESGFHKFTTHPINQGD